MSDEFRREVRKIHKERFLKDLPSMLKELFIVVGVVVFLISVATGA